MNYSSLAVKPRNKIHDQLVVLTRKNVHRLRGDVEWPAEKYHRAATGGSRAELEPDRGQRPQSCDAKGHKRSISNLMANIAQSLVWC